ncbi:MAG: GNAT family N-acetyltransferase [Bacillota bacterium]
MYLEVTIEDVNVNTQAKARAIILAGLEERFGVLDHQFNTDLEDIIENYINQNYVFLIGTVSDCPVCTGALIKETEDVGRVVRMSVLNQYRRKGIASIMLQRLEERARLCGYKKIVLETTNTWKDAEVFYLKNGFSEYYRDDEEVHLEKYL